MAELTEREVEVVTLVAAGMTNPQIAARLGLSPLTVKSHLDRIRAKTDVEPGQNTRVAIVMWSLRRGVIR